MEKVIGGFWQGKQELVRRVTNDAVYRRFEETGRIHAFACGYPELDPVKPHFFWDSDVAKWIEGSAYLLAEQPDAALTAKIEAILDDMERHQQPDGYFNIYFETVDPAHRFTYRTCHELYCAGHLMEAAVAYHEATGKDRFLKMMCRYADLIDRVFRVEQSAAFYTPGHEEIELALIRLWKATGEERYRTLARWFVLERGKHAPERVQDKYFETGNCQDLVPCRQRRTADGHAVRMLYLACAMADLAGLDGDEELKTACRAVFEDIWNSKYSVTGGFAARAWQRDAIGEAFPELPYYLPNETAYNETCASIAYVMFAARLARWWPDGRVTDLAERALYNTALSGVSLSGDRFFYTNPMEIHRSLRRVANGTDRLPITQRVKVFECSCCPPNLTRLYSHLAPYAFHEDGDTVFLHHYMPLMGESVCVETDYPLGGSVAVHAPAGKKLALRIPGFTESFEADAPYTLRDGYAYFAVSEVKLTLHFAPRFLQSDPRVARNNGCVAVQWGPFVYCAEGQDNGGELWNLYLDTTVPPRLSAKTIDGVPCLTVKAVRKAPQTALYAPASRPDVPVEATLIPYYCFANRGEDDMAVWLRQR